MQRSSPAPASRCPSHDWCSPSAVGPLALLAGSGSQLASAQDQPVNCTCLFRMPQPAAHGARSGKLNVRTFLRNIWLLSADAAAQVNNAQPSRCRHQTTEWSHDGHVAFHGPSHYVPLSKRQVEPKSLVQRTARNLHLKDSLASVCSPLMLCCQCSVFAKHAPTISLSPRHSFGPLKR